MVQTTSTRIREAVAPIVFVVIIVLGVTAQIAGAADELSPALQLEKPSVREALKRSCLSPITLAVGISLLGAAGLVYCRVRTKNGTPNGTPPVVTPPTVTYAAHWDIGTQEVEADAPLSSGPGLCLVPGVKRVATVLETDDLVAAGHETEGVRR